MGGDKNVIHTQQNSGVDSVFASLYNLLCKDVEQYTLSQAPMPFGRQQCPKHFETLVLAAFRFFVQHTAQGCGKSVHAFGDHAQNTGIYSVLGSLCAQMWNETVVTSVHAFGDHAQNTGMCDSELSDLLKVGVCNVTFRVDISLIFASRFISANPSNM